MDHPYQRNKFIKQESTDYIAYDVEEASSDNMQVSRSEPTSYIMTSQLSRVAKSKVKQEVIMPDPFVMQIKTEADPYLEDIKIKLEPLITDEVDIKDEIPIHLKPYAEDDKINPEPLKESNWNEDMKIKLEPTEKMDTGEGIKIKLEPLIIDDIIIKDEIYTCNETNMLSNKIVPKRFDCDLCTYSCANKDQYKKHIKRTHTKIKECDKCEFVTRTNKKLKIHMYIHEGEKLYKCSLCEFQAPMKISLIRHRKKHKGKIFLCELCNFRTLSINELLISQHIKLHENKIFKCDLCGYKSLKKNKYNAHIKKHELDEQIDELESGEYKIYFKKALKELMEFNYEKKCCSICKFKASKKNKLGNHMKVHVTKDLLELIMRGDKSHQNR